MYYCLKLNDIEITNQIFWKL